MPSGHLYGWDESGNDWVKVECNADGKLYVDATLILENPPTEDEASKAPSSEWAYDHWKDVSAHHVKYTDVESRAAIFNILNQWGQVTGNFNFNGKGIVKLRSFELDSFTESISKMYFFGDGDGSQIKSYGLDDLGAYTNLNWLIFNGVTYVSVIRTDTFQAALDDYLEESPTDGVSDKAPTSNWAYDHENDSSIHFPKYTDLEAQQAVNLDGDLYLSLPGLSFVPKYPHTDAHQYFVDGSMRIEAAGIDVRCAVILPEGCTVTAVIVDGDAGAASQTWTLLRVLRDGRSSVNMESATVQTEDTSISYATIDNITYLYLITCLGLTTNDVIYNARIKYTL